MVLVAAVVPVDLLKELLAQAVVVEAHLAQVRLPLQELMELLTQAVVQVDLGHHKTLPQ